MDNQTLENQAWVLRVKLNRLIETECIGIFSRSISSIRKERLYHAHARAYTRFLRRQNKLFDYKPDGFASSPAQPSGVSGQEATI